MAYLQRLWAAWTRLNKQYPRTLAWLKVTVVFGLFWLYSWMNLDPDFGWHLSAGNYIRQHWVPAHDIYTYTARNYRWIDHEWGNDVITSILYQIGGYTLTTIVFAAAWTAGLCLFRRKLSLTVLLLAMASVLPYAGVRPTTWTVLCLALLLELCGNATKRAKITIPVLFLFWANLHGGFIIGLAIVAYCFLKDRRRSWLVVLLASILASFINPYGPRLYVEIAHTLFDPALHAQITEWRSFYIQFNGCVLVALWGGGFWLFDRTKLRNWLSISSFLLLASLSATRNFPLFVVGCLRDTDRYLKQIRLPKKLDRFGKSFLAVFYLSVICVIIYGLHSSFFPWMVNRYSTYPVQEVTYLQTHNCPAHLFNDYSFGGYLIWKLPGAPVYIDGRMPTWHDPNGESYMDRYIAILRNTSAQKAEFARYNIRCALLSNTDKRLVNSLKNQGWSLKSTGNNAVLLEK